MRILLNLEPNQNTDILLPREYIRNFIYSALKDTEYDNVHNDEYKHFCYSNFFPFEPNQKLLKKAQTYNLLISSPDEKLVKLISKKVIDRDGLRLGQDIFKVKGMKFIKAPSKIDNLITATPIVIRIPSKYFEEYGIKSEENYEFWTDEIFLNAFLEALIKNGVRRYNHFCRFSSESERLVDEENLPLDLFKKFKFKKPIYAWDKHFMGTLWEFEVAEKYQAGDLIKYLYDAGLGERNASSGSGFVNILNKK
jgi:CRISPR-associated endoribonuclease Cas6